MKPSPRYDFPVGVFLERADHTPPRDAVHEGIYTVMLNHSFSIEVVPQLDRHAPWPPTLPDDEDEIQTPDEARRYVVGLSRYVVTPDPARAGTIETLQSDDRVTVLFYVGVAEHVALTEELEAISEQMTGVHSAVAVSTLAGTALARFLLERFLPSGHVSDRKLHLLGRGPGAA